MNPTLEGRLSKERVVIKVWLHTLIAQSIINKFEYLIFSAPVCFIKYPICLSSVFSVSNNIPIANTTKEFIVKGLGLQKSGIKKERINIIVPIKIRIHATIILLVIFIVSKFSYPQAFHKNILNKTK